ncbi:hypothetical protein BD413DRAFT_75874 [Trametes elegans]|nr:hypothetical protein BD413DRAFT_75874 [Trametes elegans]
MPVVRSCTSPQHLPRDPLFGPASALPVDPLFLLYSERNPERTGLARLRPALLRTPLAAPLCSASPMRMLPLPPAPRRSGPVDGFVSVGRRRLVSSVPLGVPRHLLRLPVQTRPDGTRVKEVTAGERWRRVRDARTVAQGRCGLTRVGGPEVRATADTNHNACIILCQRSKAVILAPRSAPGDSTMVHPDVQGKNGFLAQHLGTVPSLVHAIRHSWQLEWRRLSKTRAWPFCARGRFCPALVVVLAGAVLAGGGSPVRTP